MSEDKPYRLTDHAQEEAERRGISIDLIDAVMNAPGQIVDAYSERKVYQSRHEIEGKPYLMRIIVEETDPLTIITVYRTSNIKKYWSDGS